MPPCWWHLLLFSLFLLTVIIAPPHTKHYCLNFYEVLHFSSFWTFSWSSVHMYLSPANPVQGTYRKVSQWMSIKLSLQLVILLRLQNSTNLSYNDLVSQLIWDKRWRHQKNNFFLSYSEQVSFLGRESSIPVVTKAFQDPLLCSRTVCSSLAFCKKFGHFFTIHVQCTSRTEQMGHFENGHFCIRTFCIR